MDPTGELLGGPRAQVRGQTTWHAKASFAAIAGATLFDAAWICAVYALTVRQAWVQPSLPAKDAWILLGVCAAMLALQLKTLGGTLGQRLWNLRWREGWIRSSGSLDFGSLLTRALISLAATLIIALTLGLSTLRHPTISRLKVVSLPAFRPSGPNANEWLNLPFFYAMGAWPKRFELKPILYSLPYEKGPPDRFLGRIVVRMKSPDIRLEIEGPKTPLRSSGLTWNATSLRACFTDSVFQCPRARDATLERHLGEIRAARLKIRDVRWFEIENPGLTEDARPRGLWIRSSGDYEQDRFVLITANGTHQTLILRTPKSESGELARTRLQQIVGSLQLVEQLLPGRALINHVLENTRLNDVSREPDAETVVENLSSVQAALLAKLSVSPADIDAYYHLGGTALMLAQQASQRSTRTTSVATNVPLLFLNEAVAVQKNILDNVRQYAKDVGPNDEKTKRLERLWVEIQKL